MAAVHFFASVVIVLGFLLTFYKAKAENNLCPTACACLGQYVDCSRLGLIEVPKDLPSWVTNLELQSNGISELHEDDFKGLNSLEFLDLSNNEISSISEKVFSQLTSLKELKINSNKLREIPVLQGNPQLASLQLTHNDIQTINGTILANLKQLDQLDLAHNVIMHIPVGSFPSNLSLHKLSLSSNKIFSFEANCLNNLTELEALKLNKNQVSHLPKDLFQNLTSLKTLDLAKNQLKSLDGLVFKGLRSLQVLKLRRNSISTLSAGVFYGLSKIQSLQVDQNNLTSVSREWLYGLDNLRQLSLSHNKISTMESDGWEYCQHLQVLDVSNNELTTIATEQFSRLQNLKTLHMANNRIEVIQSDGFKHLSSLEELDLNNNMISWTIEDVKGAFLGLTHLQKLGLETNRIKTITKQAFTGLDSLEELSLRNNNITSIHGNAFDMMTGLRVLEFNTSSLLCDCQLSWLPMWLRDNNFEHAVIAKCAHPENVVGRSIFVVSSNDFKCDGHFPKPIIIKSPEPQKLLKGENVTLLCTATSTETQGSPTQFQWKKENVLLVDGDIESYADHSGSLTNYTSKLHIRNAQDEDTGRYQCIISNEFGSAYSKKANVDVFIFPVFTKRPENVTAKAGTSVRLVCAAAGQPQPEIIWQKDGGDHFPAAQERRMHVIPADDHFYIVQVKPEDKGVYSCIASNDAGTITANITLTVLQKPSFVKPMSSTITSNIGGTTVLECMTAGSPHPKLSWFKDGKPLQHTPRHFFTSENQIIVIVDTGVRDAGDYTCEMTNTLGTERGTSKLVLGGEDGSGTVGESTHSGDGGLDDESTTTGIIIIAVVCCVVGTSLVWVIIIYQTRKRQELYSATPTDETTLPGEVPSSGYTSSDKEGSYSHPVAMTVPGYQYQMDMQMKESGYESSSGRFRAARTAAIFPSDVDDGEVQQNYALLAGEPQYGEQSDENSVSSMQYPRSETDSIKSDNSGDSSRCSGQNTLTTFHPTPTNHDRIGPAGTGQASPPNRASTDTSVRTDNSSEPAGQSSAPCEPEAVDSAAVSCTLCRNCASEDDGSGDCQCRQFSGSKSGSSNSPPKLPPKHSRPHRHGRHKDHLPHSHSSQPPGGISTEDVPPNPQPVHEGHIEGVQSPLYPGGIFPRGYHRQTHPDYPEGVYVPTSVSANSPYVYHPGPVNTPPCDCHLHYAPPSSLPHRQPDQRTTKDNTNPRSQKLNGVVRCVHHHVNPAWHGHAYTLPYIHPSAIHQMQTSPPPPASPPPQLSPRADSLGDNQQTEQTSEA